MTNQEIFVKTWDLHNEELHNENHEFYMSLDECGRDIHSQAIEAANHFSSMEDPKEIFKKNYK